MIFPHGTFQRRIGSLGPGLDGTCSLVGRAGIRFLDRSARSTMSRWTRLRHDARGLRPGKDETLRMRPPGSGNTEEGRIRTFNEKSRSGYLMGRYHLFWGCTVGGGGGSGGVAIMLDFRFTEATREIGG